MKRRVTQAKPLLKGLNIFCTQPSSWPGLRSSAHSAGVSVKATTPEITTAIVTVTANWR